MIIMLLMVIIIVVMINTMMIMMITIFFFFFFFVLAEATVNTLHFLYAPGIGPVHPIWALVLRGFPFLMLDILV